MRGHSPTASRLTPNALTVLRVRYLKKNPSGKPVETPAQMFRRVARNIARAESRYNSDRNEHRRVERTFHGMISRLEFLPNSPTLMNAGRDLQ